MAHENKSRVIIFPHVWSPKAHNEIFADVFKLDEQVIARPFLPSDAFVSYLLTKQFPHYYPRHMQWLNKKIDEIIAGRAIGYVMQKGATVVGLAIETPKSEGNVKLNLFYFGRHLGLKQIGKLLFHHLVDRWAFRDVGIVYCTTPTRTHEEKKTGSTCRYFLMQGMQRIAEVADLYTPDTVEAVLVMDIHAKSLMNSTRLVQVGKGEKAFVSWQPEAIDAAAFRKNPKVILPVLGLP